MLRVFLWERGSVYLVFSPQQVEILAVDAVADEVHPVVFDTKIQVSKPEHEPKNRAALLYTTLKNIDGLGL